MYKPAILFTMLVLAIPLMATADENFLEKSLGDFKEELDIAKSKKKKGVFVFFEQKGCPYCLKMKTTVFNRKDVQTYFKKHFLIFSVNMRLQEEITDFQGNQTTQKKFFFKISGNRDATPVMAFFDLNGKLVTRYIGATKDAKEFMMLGEYAATRAYTKKTFARFKADKK